ncbi:arylsulfatase [Portibacter marinus]|uniref:arylsulfatase n=1 Tax=Portibacter marinus TaxID=2898660 RepID=UPI001F3A38EA|nr:arylsulfatase [Portibacter marinus]
MSYIIKTIVFIFFTAICFGQQKPNIIIILTDDQGWGDLSFTGNENISTPNIDQLAAEGVFFENFFVSPVCSPTRAEILTGRFYTRGGVYSVHEGGERLDADETTIANVLKDAGYVTAAFGKWHNGTQPPYHPICRGFDEFYGFTSGHWGSYFSPMLDHNNQIVKGSGYLPDDLTTHALNFIEDHQSQPFFVFLPYNTPHSPMQVPEPYWQKQLKQPLTIFHKDQEKEDTMFTKAALAMVENIDDNVGRISQKISDLDLENNTIIIFLSDNGPNSWRWNNRMKGRKGSTDEGGVKSPFIIKWKGKLEAGKRHKAIASSLDILPTLTAIAGIEWNAVKPLDGINMFDSTDHKVIYSYWNDRLSLRTQRFRLDHEDLLFDMNNDPEQQKDVSKLFPEMHQDLLRLKEKWLEEVASEVDPKIARPFPVGHSEYPNTQMPARDAKYTGEIQSSNRWPNCSFLTNWTGAHDSIFWEVEVLTPGTYQAEIYHTANEEALGSEVTLGNSLEATSGLIQVVHDPPLHGMQYDVVPREEGYVKDFKILSLGKIDLKKGKQRLTLQKQSVHPNASVDFRLLILKRL